MYEVPYQWAQYQLKSRNLDRESQIMYSTLYGICFNLLAKSLSNTKNVMNFHNYHRVRIIVYYISNAIVLLEPSILYLNLLQTVGDIHEANVTEQETSDQMEIDLSIDAISQLLSSGIKREMCSKLSTETKYRMMPHFGFSDPGLGSLFKK